MESTRAIATRDFFPLWPRASAKSVEHTRSATKGGRFKMDSSLLCPQHITIGSAVQSLVATRDSICCVRRLRQPTLCVASAPRALTSRWRSRSTPSPATSSPSAPRVMRDRWTATATPQRTARPVLPGNFLLLAQRSAPTATLVCTTTIGRDPPGAVKRP